MPKQKEQLESDLRCYSVTARTLTPMLGTCPSDPNLYADFLVSKALDLELEKAKNSPDKEKIKKVKDALIAQELRLLPGQKGQDLIHDSPDAVKDVLAAEGDSAMKGLTVFRRENNSPVLLGYMIRGHLKSVFENLTDVPQASAKVGRFVHVNQFSIPLLRDGKPAQVDGQHTRPLRVTDPRTGVSRTALATSEFINPGVEFSYDFFIFPKAFSQSYNGGKFDSNEIEKLVGMGLAYIGLGQWRNAGHGACEMIKFQEKSVDWKTALAMRVQQLKNGEQHYSGFSDVL